ncbi:MAG TPA: EthD family reductase [Solirubrobacteraceae bacterium]|nr:EthD family reductase [Solirubrobacteraceae bacterium]
MYTVVYAIYPKEGMGADDFRRHLTEVHSQIGRRLPRVRSYEQYPVISAEGELGPEVGAFAVIKFDSEEDFAAAAADPVMQEAIEDAPNYARHFAAYVVDVNALV